MSGPGLPPRPDDRRPHDPAPVSPVGSVRPASGPASTPAGAVPSSEPRRAVAISYDPEHHDAPVVTAAGQGLVAEEIIRRAREAGVTVTEDRRLAAVLSQIDVGQMIPPELDAVVAEVLAYVYGLEERVAKR